MPTAAIIGGGPSGLMAAEMLLQQGLSVDLYEAKPSVGRKFLMAGKSGLNLTHAENFDNFLNRFEKDQLKLAPFIRHLPPAAIRKWVEDLGIETFEGTSQRIFPKAMKASPLLRNWLRRLEKLGLKIHLKHKWIGLSEDLQLHFSTPEKNFISSHDIKIFALGGASWPKLGSDANWVNIFQQQNIPITPFRPSNCGFNVNWSNIFLSKYSGAPVKSCSVSVSGFSETGDFIITDYGLEGGVIYTHSRRILNEMREKQRAIISIDLIPEKTYDEIFSLVSKEKGKNTLTNHLRKNLNLSGVRASLLREFTSPEKLKSIATLTKSIKELQIPIYQSQSIDRAISSAGGICFDAIDSNLMIKKMPGFFVTGEMLDWDAPTGGYLLTACFALGRGAANGAVHWLKN
jgi:uncharacterized flavoprotein (TIGR03862 family)